MADEKKPEAPPQLTAFLAKDPSKYVAAGDAKMPLILPAGMPPEMRDLIVENERLAAEIERLRAQGGVPEGWQDISSAPKDGTEVLLRTPTRRCVSRWFVLFDEQYWFGVGPPSRNPEDQPTHWVPLPPSPDDRTNIDVAHSGSLNQTLPESSPLPNVDGLREALTDSLHALQALLNAVKTHPAMQDRRFIPVGIQVNNAIDKARAALASTPAPVGTTEEGAGAKIIAGLRDAVAGNLTHVMIDGQAWIRKLPAQQVIDDAAVAIKIHDGVLKLKAELATATSSGIEAAAELIDRKVQDYISEHGSFDPETGATEFSSAGEEYVSTLEELAEEIRALAGTPDRIDPTLEAKVFAAVLYPITSRNSGILNVDQRADLADAIVAKLKERNLIGQSALDAAVAAERGRIDELEAALRLAAGRLTWAANANPGVRDPQGRMLVLGIADEANATAAAIRSGKAATDG